MIPRQQIVENLIQPLNPDAELRNSYTVRCRARPSYDDHRRGQRHGREVRRAGHRGRGPGAARRCRCHHPGPRAPALRPEQHPPGQRVRAHRGVGSRGRLRGHALPGPDRLGHRPVQRHGLLRRGPLRLAVGVHRGHRVRGQLQDRRPATTSTGTATRRSTRCSTSSRRRPTRREQERILGRGREVPRRRRLRRDDLPVPRRHRLEHGEHLQRLRSSRSTRRSSTATGTGSRGPPPRPSDLPA